MRKILIVCTLLLMATSTPAQAMTQGELYKYCTESNSKYGKGACDGYIVATVDLFRFLHEVEKNRGGYFSVCLPDTLTREQVTKIIINDLKDNPKNWHYNAGGLMWHSLYKVFPCPAQK